jgi:hypothetical protein
LFCNGTSAGFSFSFLNSRATVALGAVMYGIA